MNSSVNMTLAFSPRKQILLKKNISILMKKYFYGFDFGHQSSLNILEVLMMSFAFQG
jgi:hypothetical protein